MANIGVGVGPIPQTPPAQQRSVQDVPEEKQTEVKEQGRPPGELKSAVPETKDDPFQPGPDRVTGLQGFQLPFDAESIQKDIDEINQPPLEVGDFTVKNIQDSLGDLIDRQGNSKKEDVEVDPNTGFPVNVIVERTGTELADLLTRLFLRVGDEAISAIGEAGVPLGESRALGTIATAINKFTEGLPSEVAQEIIETSNLILTPLLQDLTLAGPSGLSLQELRQDIGLEGDIKFVTEENLSQAQINEARRRIKRSIERNQLPPDELEELSNNLSQTIKNNALRKAVLQDIRNRSELLLKKLPGPQRTIKVRSPTQIEITDPGEISQLNTEFDKIERNLVQQLEQDRPRATGKAIPEKVRDINEILKNFKVSDKAGNQLVLKIRMGGAKQRLGDIRKELQRFKKFTTIKFSAPGGKGRTEVQNLDLLIRELQDAIKPRETLRDKGHITHHIDDVVFGKNIKVIVDPIVQGKYEIIILPSTDLEDLLKLSSALTVEDGSLSNLTGRDRLSIKKGKTTLHTVLEFIQTAFVMEAGNDTHLIYKTKNPMGGTHVGGGLHVLYDKPLDLPESPLNDVLDTHLSEFHRFGHSGNMVRPGQGFGGNIDQRFGGKVKVSDVSAGVTGVATSLAATGIGAPLALPIEAVSGIITGLGKIFGF